MFGMRRSEPRQVSRTSHDTLGILPEWDDDDFDGRELEEAILAARRAEFSALSDLAAFDALDEVA